jgi:hypothetical protein
LPCFFTIVENQAWDAILECLVNIQAGKEYGATVALKRNQVTSSLAKVVVSFCYPLKDICRGKADNGHDNPKTEQDVATSGTKRDRDAGFRPWYTSRVYDLHHVLLA